MADAKFPPPLSSPKHKPMGLHMEYYLNSQDVDRAKICFVSSVVIFSPFLRLSEIKFRLFLRFFFLKTAKPNEEW